MISDLATNLLLCTEPVDCCDCAEHLDRCELDDEQNARLVWWYACWWRCCEVERGRA